MSLHAEKLFLFVVSQDWNDYYNRSSASLTSLSDGVIEYCDCHRKPIPFSASGNADVSLEDRFFRDTRGGLRLSYIQAFAFNPMHGHNTSWIGADEPGSCSDPAAAPRPDAVCEPQRGCAAGSSACGEGGEPWHWTAQFHEGEGLDLLPRLFPREIPFAVVLNMGIWGCPTAIAPAFLAATERLRQRYASGWEPSTAEPGSGGVNSSAAGGPPYLYYKTTTAIRGYADRLTCVEEPSIVRTLASAGWRLLDAWNATAAAEAHDPWIDTFHFTPPIYRGLNELLLEDLLHDACGEGAV